MLKAYCYCLCIARSHVYRIKANLAGDVLSELFVIATPIGNLKDLSARAIEVLGHVSLIAAEDTRRTGQLLSEHGIATKMVSYHAHNEETAITRVLDTLDAGDNVALVSDAGTPLISDPGFPLVRECLRRGIKVVPIPGPSAVIAALSVAGIATNQFSFEGFVSTKEKARREKYSKLAGEERTMVFFEAPHRILASLKDLQVAVGADRVVTICRELTKTFEQIKSGPVSALVTAIESGDIPAKGEFVFVVTGNPAGGSVQVDDRLLVELLKELPPTKASSIVAKLSGEPKAEVYQRALAHKQRLESK